MNNMNTKIGDSLTDVYCRGCHVRPSYKNINTYYCKTCWDRWNQLRRSAEVLEDSEVDGFKKELKDFIKSRGRYVWHTEVYLHLRPIALKELKRHNIKVAVICRELGFFAPSDDQIIRQSVQRVESFVAGFIKIHDRTPNVREVIARTGLDHTTLWSCMDYEAYIVSLGGRILTNARHRFRDHDEFLQAAAAVVREADCPLHMTVILEELGMSYPTYLDNFNSVNPEAIHNAAGVVRSCDGLASLLEVAGYKALNELGWEVETQVGFPDLVGQGGRLLHYDFRLVGTTTLIEIDGAQHFDPNDTYFKKGVKKGDEMKEAYALRNGYQLVRVDTRIHKSPRSMKEFLLPRIGYGPRGPLNPSNALNATGPARRGIVRGETRDRPGPR